VSEVEAAKRLAARAAAAEAKSGMRLGLGTGSTARYATEAIGEAYAQGRLRDIVCVPTSTQTEKQARALGLPLLDWKTSREPLDLAIDGADEVDPHGQLIKGGGGALLREKAVERRARRLVIVVDPAKLSPRLGVRFALPVEVTQAAWRAEAEFLRDLGAEPALRGGDTQPFVTDNGNYVVDARFAGGIAAPFDLARALEARGGVQAHGLFLDMATDLVVGESAGARWTHYPRS
jgi:ribose 5-phosphate isomerase A